MHKFPMLLALLSTLALDSFAQSAKPVVAKDWIDQWRDVTERLIGVAEAMPADKYGYKPTDEVGTFADQVKHVCTAMRILLANAEGKQIPLDQAGLDSLKTKEEILVELRKRVDEGTAVILRIPRKHDDDVVESQFFGKTTRRFLILQAIAHDNNHYGQMVMYLRLNGITPPASR